MWVNPALAQLIPDSTLGAESSIVTPLDTLRDRIDGGAIRGSNLFHSFQDFNIDDGRGAFFSNPAGIENILTRVTGGNSSNIFGTLGVLGNANLFLINPNGIVFGPNARLDVGGSFFASTAEGITFLDGYQFSATNPNVPPLLTINVPIGLQFGANPGGIVNQSVATNDAGEVRGLEVPLGETLALVGGNVLFDRGGIVSPGSRVELAGLAPFGTVGLNPDGSLSVPSDVPRADISLLNGSGVNVVAGNGGSIAIYSQNLELSGGSALFAGIAPGMGSPDSQAGDIDIYAIGTANLRQAEVSNTVAQGSIGSSGNINIQTSSLSVIDESRLISSTFGQGNAGNVNIYTTEMASFQNSRALSGVGLGAVGNGGDLNIQIGSLFVTDGAQLTASTFSQGNAGNVSVIATEIVSFEGQRNGLPSGAGSNVEAGAVGNGGDIQISGRQVSVTNGAELQTVVRGTNNNLPGGQGNAGNVNVHATERVSFEGSLAFSTVSPGAVGNGGDLNIQTGSLSVTNGAQLSAATFGQGNAGSVNIIATETVSFAGQQDSFPSGAFSSVETGSVGDGGSLNIQTGSLLVTNSAQLSVNTSGLGNGGDLNIQTGSLLVTSGAQLSAATFRQGNAGNINIHVIKMASFEGSGAFSTVEPGSVGNGGSLNIQTGSLSVTDGAQLLASTAGQGNAGSINLTASETISFEGERNSLPSGAGSTVEAGAVGNGGDIQISGRQVSITNGAQLQTLVREANNNLPGGRGNAGNVNIRATEIVSFEGGSALSRSLTGSSVGAGAMGNGGNLNIQTRNLSVTDGAILSAGTFGLGNAGSINITATEKVSFEGERNGFPSGAFSSVEPGSEGNGGDIQISSRQVSITNGAQLQTLVRGAENHLLAGRGNAGNVNVRATDTISFDGGNNDFPSGVLSSVDSGAVGDGGDIIIQTNRLSLVRAGLTASNRGVGAAGSIDLEANSIRLDRQATLNADTFAGNEGNITVRSYALFLRNQSDITTNAFGTATGGNITLNSDVIAALENSDISANAQDAFGGRVTIDTQGLFGTAFRERLTPQSDITATSALGPDFSGTVEITPPEVEPASGLVGLPESPVDADSLFGKDFCSQRGTSQFIFTGRGGIPPSPFDPLGGSSPIEIDWVESPDSPEVEEPESRNIPSPVTRPLIEAQGWVVAADGTIVLTAQPYRGTPAPPALSYPDCQHLNHNAQ